MNTNVRVQCFLVNLIGMSRPPCVSALVTAEYFLLFLRWLNDLSAAVFALRYILVSVVCVYSYPVPATVGFYRVPVQVKLLCNLAERYSLSPKFGYPAFLFFCHHSNSTLLVSHIPLWHKPSTLSAGNVWKHLRGSSNRRFG